MDVQGVGIGWAGWWVLGCMGKWACAARVGQHRQMQFGQPAADGRTRNRLGLKMRCSRGLDGLCSPASDSRGDSRDSSF